MSKLPTAQAKPKRQKPTASPRRLKNPFTMSKMRADPACRSLPEDSSGKVCLHLQWKPPEAVVEPIGIEPMT